MYLAYGIKPYQGHGKDVVENYQGTRLEKVTNGTQNAVPMPGDILSYGTTHRWGHTSVVQSTNVDPNGNGTITVMEQNSSRDGSAILQVRNWRVLAWIPVTGWLHDPEYKAPREDFDKEDDDGNRLIPSRWLEDVNGDKRADFCRFVGLRDRPHLSCATASDTSFGHEYGFNSIQGIDRGYIDLPRWLEDVNGDDRADFCRFVGLPARPHLSCALATDTGFGHEYGFNSIQGIDRGYSTLPRWLEDVNGDDRADFCRFVGLPARPHLSCALATDTGFGHEYGFNSIQGIDRGYDTLPRWLEDVNGDDRADFCRFAGLPDRPHLSCALATDTGFGHEYGFNSIQGIDLGYNAFLDTVNLNP
jgi:hypothetical protein